MRRVLLLAFCAANLVLASCTPLQRLHHRHHPRFPTSTSTTSTTSISSTSTSPTTTSSTTTTITSPGGGSASPGGSVEDLAAWDVPAADVAISPRSADWASRLWNEADSYDHNWSIEFGLDEPSNDYSIPVYSTADATTTARIFQRPVATWNGHFDVANGSSIPWNPSWLPSDGSDAFMIITDPDSGEEWDIWALSTPTPIPGTVSQSECTLDLTDATAGFDPTASLCAASVNIITTPSGANADTRTYTGNFPWSGGGGIQNTAGLTTPAEVASGAIKHALKFAVSPEVSMTGPECPADVVTPDDPRVGTTCGTAVAPAGQFERGGTTSAPADLAHMVPEGSRIVIDDTDAQIDAWLDSRGYTGTLRQTARVFAVALRDYGLIESDTTKGPATITVEGGANPQTAAAWQALGITGDGSTLLDGLVTASNIEVLEPATNHCADGTTSHLYCWATSTGY